ncbi:MAG TPA: NCS1 family nucleobase:cation symporter-1 [Lacipirellulaceae bacterium]|jgi:NCS1 family nucleobase:cation symporter-1|nr:NCS1 family nucleobase:cation symporter-1 [Lacipirellulaceae bacterium]
MAHATASSATADDEIHELTVDVSNSPYYSADMAPVPRSGRRWGMKDIAVLWISMAACIPTYMLAAGLIDEGMNWWQAVLTIFLGNLIVLVPMVLNAHAGTKYGIPFPVYCRSSFGILGANVPALLRALVACGWFGIQTWIGGQAIYTLMKVFVPGWGNLPAMPFLGINAAQLGCFLFFWLINMWVVYNGIESIRILLNIKAPLLILLGLALLGWAYYRAGGFGDMLSQPSLFGPGQPKEGQFWTAFMLALTANVSFWGTLALNIPDFSRYARSQRDQVLGQAIGLPTTMGLYSFIGVAVTSAAYVIYADLPPEQKKALWDPVNLLAMFENKLVLVVAMIALSIATLATNIAANVVSPANDFAHLWPRRITFRIGGLITGLIGILIQPWRLLANAGVYIYTWLVGYSLLLGAVGGVLVADYIVLRRTRLDQAGLYLKDGPYWYLNGFNPRALVALALGIGVSLPGFLVAVGALAVVGDPDSSPGRAIVPTFLADVYPYAWFASFGVSFVVYLVLMAMRRRK